MFPRRLAFGLCAVVLVALFIRKPGGWGSAAEAIAWLSPMLILGGFALRAWASGCAGRHTRTNSLSAPELVTGGPFAHVRNPIYLGTAVLGLGVVGLLAEPWLVVPWAITLGALYGAVIPAEERHLLTEFGERYACYCAAVPRLRPRLIRWAGAAPATFRWSGAAGEVPLIAIVAGIILVLHFLQQRPLF